MTRKKKPIRRSDGKEYKSAYEAACVLAWELGDGTKPGSYSPNIIKAANRSGGRKSAYGYTWEWIVPMSSKPIMRSDGAKFYSANEAARYMAHELGAGSPRAMVTNIVNVANHRPHCNTAYGYEWEWVGE